MKNLSYMFHRNKLSKLLFEQEEAEEEVEEEAAEEESPAADEEEPADDAPAEDEAEAEEADADDQEEELSATSSLDSDIEAVLIDFESSARKSVSVEESLHRLYEQTEEIDVDMFTADVARLVKNYDNLLDIEQMLVDKASDFIKSRYDEETASAFLDKLETQHDIETEKSVSPIPSSDLETPLAIGAGASGE